MRKGSHQTPEANIKNKLAHLGKKFTAEQKIRVTEANQRINSSVEVRRKKQLSCIAFYESEQGAALKLKWGIERLGNQYAKGYRHTDKAKADMSLHRMGQQHMLGHHQSAGAKDKVSVATKGTANPMYGKHHPSEICDKLSLICKERWDNWTDEQKREKMGQLGQHQCPTHPELTVMSVLDELYPNEWEWVGNRPTVGASKPDFKNKVGRNLLVLEHGIYWHLWKPQKEHPEWGLTKEKVEAMDVTFYKKFGYDTLIVWEDELKDRTAVKEKIKQFVESK